MRIPLLNDSSLALFTSRQRFRSYKDSYKHFLHDPDSQTIKDNLTLKENDLDLFNIVVAREQAKYEVENQSILLIVPFFQPFTIVCKRATREDKEEEVNWWLDLLALGLRW